jgi:DNA ligase 1
MRLASIVETSRAVRGTASRNAKVERIAELLASAEPEAAGLAASWLSGALLEGTIGVGPAALHAALAVPAATVSTLSALDVERALAEVKAASGGGSKGVRERRLGELFAAATQEEREFVLGLLGGGLRQGALEGVVVEALARAFGTPAEGVRRAVMLAGHVGEVARVLAADGPDGLSSWDVVLFRPVAPMLADSAEDASSALARFGRAVVEAKLDGARIQAHLGGDHVRLFTRGMLDVTDRMPEVVAAVRALPFREAVLDGEALAWRQDGAPEAFQTTMRRVGRRTDVAGAAADLPLAARFFDALRLDGESLIDRPLWQRHAALSALPAGLAVPRCLTDDAAEAERFFQEMLATGHEGVMVKDPGSRYEAGKRGSSWLKVKRVRTLDLVVLAVEWGSGRREGLLSNLHLGARDPASGGFAMLGKTFKGLTDEVLAWQTKALLALETRREEGVVHVRPELVVEVAFDGVQTSPRYPAGLALRFARVRRYRPDKTAADADTVDAVRALHAGPGPDADTGA